MRQSVQRARCSAKPKPVHGSFGPEIGARRCSLEFLIDLLYALGVVFAGRAVRQHIFATIYVYDFDAR